MKPEQTGRMRQYCGEMGDSGTLIARAADVSVKMEPATQSKPLPDTGGQRTGRRGGSAMAGHLGEAHARPTLAVILTESPAHLRKRHDPELGPALIRIDA